MDITSLTAVELGKKIKAKEISVVEAVKASIAQIEKVEKDVNSFVTLDKEGALKRAEEVQKLIDDGTLTGPLAGVPVAIKDNMCTKGMLTTCSSKILGSFQPMFTAEAVKNLEAAGAVILGKTNMDEFAMGSTTETSAYGETKNPWNTAHVPGGSSGGSCAAVAAEECYYALGSDTGGSIRQPSSFCGVTGIKPTYGTVSRYGLIAYGSSLDQIGPIAKDVTDCATILETITSYDKKDSTSVKREEIDFTSALVDDVKGMKIGIPSSYFGEGLDEEVKAAILKAADILKEKGAVVETFDLGLVDYAIPAYYVIASAEASSNLSRFDGVKYGYRTKEYEGLHNMYKKTRSEGFGPEVKRRIMLGSFVLSSGYYDAYYLKALKTKALIKKAFDKAFEKYDVIVINFANPDMVGHTGILEAAIKAVETVDTCVGKAVDAIKEVNGQLFICADHGNAEQLVDYETGAPFTAHTTNPVPFILVNADPSYKLRENGCLADIIPTLIELMGMEQPAEMTGKSLLVK